MSLSVRTSAMAGNPLGSGEDWGDSPYGSLITLGPKKFKKKPVLVLADEELAQAHLAIAMGGAEIMEMQPDPVEAPRPRQPAVILGLVPMGADEPDEPTVAWTPPAPEEDDAWAPLPEFDEPEPEEADVQTWVPEDEPEEAEAFARQEDLAPESDYFEPLQAAPEPAVPSIEEQLERMRERLAKRAAATAAAVPPPPVAEPRPTTIERLEIDDWSGSASLKGFIPPQEQDLPPAPPAAPVQQARPEPAPPPAPPPAPLPEPEPQPVARFEPPAPPPVVALPEPEPELVYVPEPAAEPEPVAEAMPLDLAPYEPEPAMDEQAALDAWADHVAPVAPPRRHAGIRARLSDDWQGVDEEPAPSLLARLWGWLRSRF